MSQAIALMPALNGYGTATEATDSASAVDTAAETFVTEGLSKVLKINNICDADHLADCGFNTSITNLAGSTIKLPSKLSDLNRGIIQLAPTSIFNTKAAAFETQNGESILAFYNPACTVDTNGSLSGESYAEWYIQSNVCVNFVYDLNGNKGPNTVGKDIGIILAAYPVDSVVVAPIPNHRPEGQMEHRLAAGACTALNGDYRLPNIEELIGIYYNNTLFNLGRNADNAGWFWASNVVSPNYAMAMADETGRKARWSRDTNNNVLCIKR